MRVLCVDEKTQVLERTQPMRPLGLGYVEAPRHQEFLSFLRHMDANVPPDLAVHFVVDNYKFP